MHIEIFSSQTGVSLGVTQQLDFKDIIQNQHCTNPIVLRFVPDQEASEMPGVDWSDTIGIVGCNLRISGGYNAR
jgi:hypothetical protein